jgi:hypothetical protein
MKMANHLNNEQTMKVLYRKTVRDLLEIAREYNFPKFALADKMPTIVCDDKVITRGKNKGERRVTYWDRKLSDQERNQLAMLLTGMATFEDAQSVNHYFREDEDNKTMYTLVLGDADERFHYQAHWYHTFKEHEHLKAKLLPHLQQYVRTKDEVVAAKWYAANKERYDAKTTFDYGFESQEWNEDRQVA